MTDLLNQTLGAVGQVGDAFDKFTGGRALRGALAGKPRELQSEAPLDLHAASYHRYYRQLTDDEVLDQSYAARSAHPPKPIGGIFLRLRPEVDPITGELFVNQDFSSDIIVPWSKRKKAA